MDQATRVSRITGFTLAVADPERSARFYGEGLGFRREAQDGLSLRLSLAGVRLALQAAGHAVPSPPARADSPDFQHFAIRVSDMAAAYAHFAPLGPIPLSHGGPQKLPPGDGSVTAWKFRDPDGHPLELLQLAGAQPGAGRPLFLAIDHTALACADLEASHRFYAGLGFTPGPTSHNHGPPQDRLDGLDSVDLKIGAVFTPEPGPHVELLHYAVADRGAHLPFPSRQFIAMQAASHRRLELADPDGHAIDLSAASAVTSAP